MNLSIHARWSTNDRTALDRDYHSDHNLLVPVSPRGRWAQILRGGIWDTMDDRRARNETMKRESRPAEGYSTWHLIIVKTCDQVIDAMTGTQQDYT
jgi:hypothetical protein